MISTHHLSRAHSGLHEGLSFTFHQVADVASLGASWKMLERHSEPSFFQTWDWIEPWIVEAQLSPWLLCGQQDGRTVLMALFTHSQQRRHGFIKADTLLLHQVGERSRDVLSIGYNGFVVDTATDSQVVAKAIEHLRRVTAVPFIEVQLNSVSHDDWDVAQASGFRTILVSRHPSWRVDLADIRRSGRSYLENLSANTRYQVRRAIKLYKRRGNLELKMAGNLKEGLDYFRQLRDLNISYWSSRSKVAAFSYPFFERFHRRLIERCLPKGNVELVRISAGEAPIGFLYNFVYKGRVYAYQSGFAYENDPKLKPGLVSHQLCIEQHLRRGAEAYDFLAGHARYKTNLGVAGPDVFDCSLQKPSAALQLESFLRRVKRRTVATIRRPSS